MPLFEKSCCIDFFASQRVSEENEEHMSLLLSNGGAKFYQNNVLSFAGINASGKTTVLKLISFVCSLLANEPLNGNAYPEIFDGLKDGEVAVFESFFLSGTSVYLLRSAIAKENGRLVIKSESLKEKNANKIKTKKDLLELSDCKIVLARDADEPFLLDDVSIMVAFNKASKDVVSFCDLLHYTNANELSISSDCPGELIAFFDPSIEHLRIRPEGKESRIGLKFRGKEEIVLSRLAELNRYLSSGTIKGINVFLAAIRTFQTGGYLIIDELENHFNHEIVSTLIRFYMDKKVNPRGATLLFSTHYAELLNEMARNDNIYITKNDGGINVTKLTSLLKRNDIKKSDAYESGYLDGTAPQYEAYMALKKALVKQAKEGER